MDANYEFKRILLPTDFSESAFMAMQHAARLASVCNGKLTLLNIREAFSESVLQKEFGIILKNDKDYIDHVNKLLKEKADSIKASFGIEVEYISKSGNLAKEVADFVKNNDINLVVLGMHGLKGRDSYFMGGNAYKIVSTTKVPVLQVEADAKETKYKTIVLPVDSSFHTREKIPYATKIAKAFGSEIKIAGLLTSKNEAIKTQFLKVMHQVEHYIAAAGVKHSKEVLDSDNLAKDTMQYAEKHNADLIVIMSEQEKSISGIFLGPYAQQLVQNSKIPILTIPPKVSMVMADVTI